MPCPCSRRWFPRWHPVPAAPSQGKLAALGQAAPRLIRRRRRARRTTKCTQTRRLGAWRSMAPTRSRVANTPRRRRAPPRRRPARAHTRTATRRVGAQTPGKAVPLARPRGAPRRPKGTRERPKLAPRWRMWRPRLPSRTAARWKEPSCPAGQWCATYAARGPRQSRGARSVAARVPWVAPVAVAQGVLLPRAAHAQGRDGS
mmetsp:Transcript_20239/g.60627  ORF Transcript_20239/g.60627 Transcript_20239/m.60627 type:complete len:202 (-) Transcript_20239:166-771(-)